MLLLCVAYVLSCFILYPCTSTAAFAVQKRIPLRKSSSAAMSAAAATFNFGPVSARDATVFTCERPGNSLLDDSTTTLSLENVQPWLDFMASQGITDVVALLDENELAVYQDPPGLLGIYQSANMVGEIVSMSQPNACKKIIDILQQVSLAGGKVVCHCTGGVGRAGRVAAAWLVHAYNLSPEEATAETLAMAKEFGVNRKGDVNALKKWMGVE